MPTTTSLENYQPNSVVIKTGRSDVIPGVIRNTAAAAFEFKPTVTLQYNGMEVKALRVKMESVHSQFASDGGREGLAALPFAEQLRNPASTDLINPETRSMELIVDQDNIDDIAEDFAEMLTGEIGSAYVASFKLSIYTHNNYCTLPANMLDCRFYTNPNQFLKEVS